MSLVTAVELSLAFVGRPIFKGIGFQIEPGDRIGLVGPNGSGKTTLLRILGGEAAPDSGEVRVVKGTRIGYLPQDVREKAHGTLLRSVLDAIPGRRALLNDIERIAKVLASPRPQDETVKLGQRLAELHLETDRLDLTFPQHEAEKILLGLGFRVGDFDGSLTTLSGGWQTRAALARLLFQKPDLLLLDEPTNHLDIPTVRWLDGFLHDLKGAMVLVCHDREFLNSQVRRIWSLERGQMRNCSGDYDAYLKAVGAERALVEAKARNQEQKIKEAQKFIDRFRAKSSKARQAQSKIKLIEKIELVKTRPRDKTLHFSFPDVPPSGRVVLSAESLSKGFGATPLYRDTHLTILRGDRVAVIGPNGCGKTTLLRIIAGEVSPDSGRVTLGHGVALAYFAQHHSEMLDTNKTVIEEVYQAVPGEHLTFVRNVCGAFLFSGQDVDKPVGVLSGGEKARVSLAKLLVKPGNFMIMDEPTNHLDLISTEILVDALSKYGGTLLFVSHNQAFVNRLATKIWDIRDGEIVEYPGNLTDYYDHLERQAASQQTYPTSSDRPMESAPTDGDRTQEATRTDRKNLKREKAERRRLVYDTLQPILREIEQLESKIAERESRQKDLEILLGDPVLFSDEERSVSVVREYREIREEVGALLKRWEDRQGALEKTKKNLGI